MKVIIAGGTGFLGGELTKHFSSKGDEVIVLTRSEKPPTDSARYVQWNGRMIDSWVEELEGSELLINLTGKSVDCRYTEKNKTEIMRSRVDATTILGRAIEQAIIPPRLWINASTATIYRYSTDQEMDEYTGEIGSDFSMSVANAWEEALYRSHTPKTRKVALRISLVLGESGGVYPVFKRLAKFGVAGKMGSGKQRFAWIHIKDVLRIVDFIHEKENLEGAVNCTAPDVPTNAEFLRLFRNSLGVSIGIPQPKWLLKIGAILIGTESELILKSRWVIPLKLKDEGFVFKFDTPEKALNDLAKKV